MSTRTLHQRRARRTRHALRQAAGDRLRLSVFRSIRHTAAQIIDDRAGRTLASSSTLEPALRDRLASGGAIAAAEAVGALVAERALAAGVSRVVLDRGGHRYHGRVKALADAARAGGLEF